MALSLHSVSSQQLKTIGIRVFFSLACHFTCEEYSVWIAQQRCEIIWRQKGAMNTIYELQNLALYAELNREKTKLWIAVIMGAQLCVKWNEKEKKKTKQKHYAIHIHYPDRLVYANRAMI